MGCSVLTVAHSPFGAVVGLVDPSAAPKLGQFWKHGRKILEGPKRSETSVRPGLSRNPKRKAWQMAVPGLLDCRRPGCPCDIIAWNLVGLLPPRGQGAGRQTRCVSLRTRAGRGARCVGECLTLCGCASVAAHWWGFLWIMEGHRELSVGNRVDRWVFMIASFDATQGRQMCDVPPLGYTAFLVSELPRLADGFGTSLVAFCRPRGRGGRHVAKTASREVTNMLGT